MCSPVQVAVPLPAQGPTLSLQVKSSSSGSQKGIPRGERHRKNGFYGFIFKKQKRLKKSFISNPAWGCEWGIERIEKGTHPPLGRVQLFPGSLQHAGQVRGRPHPSRPASSMGSSHCCQQVLEVWEPRLKAALFTSVVTPALPPWMFSGPHHWALRVGRQARPGGSAWPSPLAASSMPSVTQQGSRGGGRHRAGRGCRDTMTIWKGKSPANLHRFLTLPLHQGGPFSHSPSRG